jgi:hypothetical protein
MPEMPQFFQDYLRNLSGEQAEELARWFNFNLKAQMDTLMFLIERGQRFPTWKPGVGSTY